MTVVAARTPPLFPAFDLTERVLNSPVGRLASGFHVHSVDESLSEIYTESVMGTYSGLKVRSIRSLPRRPISLGPKTPPGHIDHIGLDFLEEPVPTVLDFDGIRDSCRIKGILLLRLRRQPKTTSTFSRNRTSQRVRKKLGSQVPSASRKPSSSASELCHASWIAAP